MKVAYFVNQFPKISETFVLNQVYGLMRAGLEIEVRARGRGDVDAIAPTPELDALLRNTHIMPPPPSRAARFLGAPPALLRLAREGGSISSVFDARYFGRRMLSLSSLSEAASCPVSDAEAVVAHFLPEGVRAWQHRRLGLIDAPIIVFAHGYDIARWASTVPRRRFKRFLDETDLFLPISERWRSRLIDMGADPAKVVLHRMGVEPESIPTSEGRRLGSAPALRITMVGRMVEKKGHTYALQALSRLPKGSFTCRVIGDGELHGALREQTKALGIDEAVHFGGFIPHREVLGVVANETDVFLLPSVTSSDGDQEGVPVSLMEACAAGVPVVSTEHSGIPELVTHGENGLLSPERDAESLAENLRRLADDRDLLRRLGAAGPAVVAERFDNHMWNRRLVEHIERLTGRTA